MTWLVTGGAGYIGQHVVRAMLADGHQVVVLDDLSTGHAELLPDGVTLVQGDVCSLDELDVALAADEFRGVMHLAGLKAADESVLVPLDYYRTNVAGTVALLTAMLRHGVWSIVFSSSCSVYGNVGDSQPVDEHHDTEPVSPYGRSKLMAEQVIGDAANAYGLSAISLRYFNVAGAGSPELGDRGAGNLIPLATRAIVKDQPPVVFGDDYPTSDGTCVRDYIDVRDLADAHVLAARQVSKRGHSRRGHPVYNLGTGKGSSVLEVIRSLAAAAGVHVEPEMAPRRPGDPAVIFANPAAVLEDLGWRARYTLHETLASAWDARGVTT
jgi:UDP-glucose 4-epimerase